MYFFPLSLASRLSGIKDKLCLHPVKRPDIPTQASRGSQNRISLIQLIELITISNSSVVMNLYSGAFNGAPYRLVRKTVLKSTRVNFLRSCWTFELKNKGAGSRSPENKRISQQQEASNYHNLKQAVGTYFEVKTDSTDLINKLFQTVG